MENNDIYRGNFNDYIYVVLKPRGREVLSNRYRKLYPTFSEEELFNRMISHTTDAIKDLDFMVTNGDINLSEIGEINDFFRFQFHEFIKVFGGPNLDANCSMIFIGRKVT